MNDERKRFGKELKKKKRDEKYIKSFLSNLKKMYKPGNIKMIALGYYNLNII